MTDTSAPLAPADDPRVAVCTTCGMVENEMCSNSFHIDAAVAALRECIKARQPIYRHEVEPLLAAYDALAARVTEQDAAHTALAAVASELSKRTAELERENAELHGEVAAYRETRTSEVIADLKSQLAAAREDSTLIDALAKAMAEHTPPPGSVVGRGQLVIGIDHWADRGKFDVGIAGAHAEDHETIADALRAALRQLTDRHEETRNATD